jgi:hypothetical protein
MPYFISQMYLILIYLIIFNIFHVCNNVIVLTHGCDYQVLSLATRAQLFEYISLLLRRGKFKDSCLTWVVALLNTSSGENLVETLPDYTCRALVEALVAVSSEPSNRGVLAARLEAQMLQQYS